tara:strand:+ start:816 stop:1001 length:186 start_codon:yes stop_codon:yes gene_type:complete
MKTEQQIFDMLDRFMAVRNQYGQAFNAEIDATITALDWVLGRVDTEELVYELTVDTAHDEG